MIIGLSNITIDNIWKASNDELDALYSHYCLGDEYYFNFVEMKFLLRTNDEQILKYCDSFGVHYVIEKIVRVLKKDGVSKRHS